MVKLKVSFEKSWGKNKWHELTALKKSPGKTGLGEKRAFIPKYLYLSVIVMKIIYRYDKTSKLVQSARLRFELIANLIMSQELNGS